MDVGVLCGSRRRINDPIIVDWWLHPETYIRKNPFVPQILNDEVCKSVEFVVRYIVSGNIERRETNGSIRMSESNDFTHKLAVSVVNMICEFKFIRFLNVPDINESKMEVAKNVHNSIL
ncbi:hypothetical protein MCEREM21A_00007 [Sphingomonadaceae bacterium]